MTTTRVFAIAAVTVMVAGCGRQSEPPVREADNAVTKGGPAVSTESADKDSAADVIELSTDAQRRLGVTVAAATNSRLAVTLRVTGTVQPIESRISHVRPLANGRVVDVRARVGDRVTSGQPLATFDNIEAGDLASQYSTARSELARLRTQLATVSRQVERDRQLVDIGATPQKQYEASLGEQQQLEQSIRGEESTISGMETRLRRFGINDPASADRTAFTTIRAPFAGVVTEVRAGAGEVVDASTELFSVADISRVNVQAQVYEKDLGRVQRGQIASIQVDAYPDRRFSGRVVSIGDTVDPQTRTTTVRCEVANPEALLKLDMFATVDLPTAVSEETLAVPNEAIQTWEGKSVVFVRTAPSKFVARPVEAGSGSGSMTAIVRGLKPGEVVVTHGAFQVKSAAQAGALGDKD